MARFAALISKRGRSLYMLDDDHVVGSGSSPAFANSWVQDGTRRSARFWRDPWGVVHLEGSVKSGTVNTGATGVIFTLPEAYRPEAELRFAVASNGAYGECRVGADGTVKAAVGNNTIFSLDGISYRVPA
jgi:hypothetical protein